MTVISIRSLVLGAAFLATALTDASSAHAADKIRAGKAINVIWAMIPLDIGAQQGLFAKYGIDVDITTMSGGAKLEQGLIAGSLDIGIDGGTSLAFAAKGAPVIGIAAVAGAPSNFAVVVAADSSIGKVADLKGKLLGVATNGSFPQWLIKRLAVAQGWGPDGIRTVALGGFEASASAMETHETDGFMGAVEGGLTLAEKGKAKIVTTMGSYVPYFHNHVLMARKELVAEHPDTVKRFLQGFFAAVAYMKSHRDETIKISSDVMHMSTAVIAKTYDDEIGMMSDDGAFDPQAIEVLKDTYVDMGMLQAKPATDQLITTQFTPVKP
ncbi:MAG TPA: ABC transporter substrate-binding protein [Stellaceae bacterium]|jgi:ABC-type nitrate/sulfonate/bicarbonate transport system substrate-binding protein|nr:ABC transporter substrate-binding protein [Stellaceae bacterium]